MPSSLSCCETYVKRQVRSNMGCWRNQHMGVRHYRLLITQSNWLIELRSTIEVGVSIIACSFFTIPQFFRHWKGKNRPDAGDTPSGCRTCTQHRQGFAGSNSELESQTTSNTGISNRSELSWDVVGNRGELASTGEFVVVIAEQDSRA